MADITITIPDVQITNVEKHIHPGGAGNDTLNLNKDLLESASISNFETVNLGKKVVVDADDFLTNANVNGVAKSSIDLTGWENTSGTTSWSNGSVTLDVSGSAGADLALTEGVFTFSGIV